MLNIKEKIIKIKSGGNHHAALTEEGYLYFWGIGVYASTL